VGPIAWIPTFRAPRNWNVWVLLATAASSPTRRAPTLTRENPPPGTGKTYISRHEGAPFDVYVRGSCTPLTGTCRAGPDHCPEPSAIASTAMNGVTIAPSTTPNTAL
jgi:hypothetical protein